jgi:transcriptional regulator with XRE-family HTH domain
MEPDFTFEELFKIAEKNIDYAVEGAILAFTEQVVGRMKVLELNRTRLAEKIGVSPAYITKMLRGDTNFTLESMVKVGNALGAELKLALVPKSEANAWINLLQLLEPPKNPVVEVWGKINQERSHAGLDSGPAREFNALNQDSTHDPANAVAALAA